MRSTKQKPLRVISIRLAPRDHEYVSRLVKAKLARNRTDAIRYALQFTVEKVAA